MSEYGWRKKVAGTGVSRYVWKEKLAGTWSLDLWLGRNSGVKMIVPHRDLPKPYEKDEQ